MGAAETIQAAIDKLEAFKAQPVVTATFSADPASQEGAWFGRAEEKLAIFHRTIDAQLAILRDASEALERVAGLGLDWGLELDLARAILGEVTPDAS